MDSKRQKFKEDLEQREKQAGVRQKSADVILKEEIERLRKEGSKAVEEEIQYVSRKVQESMNVTKSGNSIFRIKIKWTASKYDISNGGYTQEMLYRFLSKVSEYISCNNNNKIIDLLAITIYICIHFNILWTKRNSY